MSTFTEYYIVYLEFGRYELYQDVGLPEPMPDFDLRIPGQIFRTKDNVGKQRRGVLRYFRDVTNGKTFGGGKEPTQALE